MSIRMLASLLALATLSSANAQEPYTVTKTVDTGNHTCPSIGWDHKVYDVAEAPADRFFVESTVRFDPEGVSGDGNCVFTNDNGGAVERKTVTLKLANGQSVRADVPVRYHLRAYADCTNNPRNLGSRVGRECKFSAETDEYK
jgi:hypothetical protein